MNDDRTFNIFYDANLAPLTEGPTTVTVTVTASSKYDYGVGNNFSTQDDETFDVNYLNPCINSAFVDIVPATMPDQTFPIYGNEISWTHDEFVV